MDPTIVQDLLKKVVEERKEQEKAYHRERVMKLQQEKIELELRLVILNDVLKQIEEHVKNNPLLQE